MPTRRRFAFLVAITGLGALTALHCSGEPSSNLSSSSGDTTSSGNTGSGGTSGTSGGSGNTNTSSGTNVTSSGGSGTNASSSGEEPPPPPQRIERAQNLPTRSAGCGKAPPTRGADVNLGARKYIPFQGWNYSSNGPGEQGQPGYPVMVALHGCGAHARNFGEFVLFEDKVGDEGIVIYADAEHGENDGCDWKVGSETELTYLDQVLTDVAGKYCIDQSRVLVLGYSWGSYQAHHYACSRPGTVKAVIGAAGGYPDWTYPNPNTNADPRACGQIHTLIYGRTHDNNEYISKSYNARDKKLETNGCQNNPSPAAAPFVNNPNPNVVGCVDYPGCVGDLRMTFCEDPYKFANNSYNHTIWQEYHRSLWQWFTGLP